MPSWPELPRRRRRQVWSGTHLPASGLHTHLHPECGNFCQRRNILRLRKQVAAFQASRTGGLNEAQLHGVANSFMRVRQLSAAQQSGLQILNQSTDHGRNGLGRHRHGTPSNQPSNGDHRNGTPSTHPTPNMPHVKIMRFTDAAVSHNNCRTVHPVRREAMIRASQRTTDHIFSNVLKPMPRNNHIEDITKYMTQPRAWTEPAGDEVADVAQPNKRRPGARTRSGAKKSEQRQSLMHTKRRRTTRSKNEHRVETYAFQECAPVCRGDSGLTAGRVGQRGGQGEGDGHRVVPMEVDLNGPLWQGRVKHRLQRVLGMVTFSRTRWAMASLMRLYVSPGWYCSAYRVARSE
jgi:hypothetical protein